MVASDKGQAEMMCDDHDARMSGSNSGSLPRCMTLGKLLKLSGFQLSHLQIAGIIVLFSQGHTDQEVTHVKSLNAACLEHGRTKIQEAASLLITGEMSTQNVSTHLVSSPSICSVISTCLTPCCMLGTEQQTKMPPRPLGLKKRMLTWGRGRVRTTELRGQKQHPFCSQITA